MLKNKNGITIIALILTIILMLLFIGIRINLVLKGELFKTAKQAVEQTEIATEKEFIKISMINAIGSDTNEKLTQEKLQYELDQNMGKNTTEVTKNGEDFEILIKDKNRIYIIDKHDNLIGPENIVKVEFAGDITKNGTLDGSSDKPYEIGCIEDLVAFSNMTNGTGVIIKDGTPVAVTKKTEFEGKTIKLVRDLDFELKRSYLDCDRTDFGDLNGDNSDGNKLITEMTTGTGFKSINEFCCIFEGNNKKIKNLYIHNETGRAGLFGLINKNLGDKYVAIMNLGVS